SVRPMDPIFNTKEAKPVTKHTTKTRRITPSDADGTAAWELVIAFGIATGGQAHVRAADRSIVQHKGSKASHEAHKEDSPYNAIRRGRHRSAGISEDGPAKNEPPVETATGWPMIQAGRACRRGAWFRPKPAAKPKSTNLLCALRDWLCFLCVEYRIHRPHGPARVPGQPNRDTAETPATIIPSLGPKDHFNRCAAKGGCGRAAFRWHDGAAAYAMFEQIVQWPIILK
ncbi:MAG: hypothetical protein P4L90_08420, partial [Rhodopila sp.]|nr:hypothetical protein [Rhodopila sp.]